MAQGRQIFTEEKKEWCDFIKIHGIWALVLGVGVGEVGQLPGRKTNVLDKLPYLVSAGVGVREQQH